MNKLLILAISILLLQGCQAEEPATDNTQSAAAAAPANVASDAVPLDATTMHGDAPQVPAPQSPAEVTTPADGITMAPEYARATARSAYIWGWPMVNMLNRRTMFAQAPEPGLLNGVVPVAPTGRVGMLSGYVDPAETFVTCPNQDVVYGLGFFALDEEPVIAQVPDFGERFWVYALYDARTDQFGELGKPYGTRPGFYMIVGPEWDGEKPEGIEAVIRSPSPLANAIPRIFMDDTAEDRADVQEPLDQVVFYPLSEFDGKMKTTDWSEAPNLPGPPPTGEETKWVVPEKFFEQFPEVLATVPPLPGEEGLYAQYRQLMNAAKADPAIMEILVDTAVSTEAEVIKPFFQWKYNGKPAGNGWNRSTNDAEWGYDYYNRTATARSNMFDNKPNETQYFYTDFDSNGEQLDGDSSYSVTFSKGQTPPVNGFWSLTMYNDKHLFYPNDLQRYSLGTKNKNLKYNDDGSLTLYAGNTSPGKDKESNWLPAPEGTFSLYIRAYWGKESILDGSWRPPAIKKLD